MRKWLKENYDRSYSKKLNVNTSSTKMKKNGRLDWRRWLDNLSGAQIPEWSVPLALLMVCVLSYLLLVRHLGYYWDDFPFVWISQKLGSAGLFRYFYTNRPIWGLTFQIAGPLLGHEPWHWHVYALLWRWVSAVMLWVTLRQVWPHHPQPPLWISLLFVVYPGTQEQLVSVVYSHFFLVLSAFLASLACSLFALQKPRSFIPLTVLGLLLSTLNLLTLEYFFLLELIRPVLFWIATQKEARQQNLGRLVLHWVPYLILFCVSIIWRAFFYASQTAHYNFTFGDRLHEGAFSTLMSLALTVLHDLWITTFGAWLQVFHLPNPSEFGRITTITYVGVITISLIGCIVYLFLYSTPDRQKLRSERINWPVTPWAPSALMVGLIALLLAGPAFWLTGLKVSLAFPDSRFTLSFMLGASLFIGGLLGLLPVSLRTRLVILAVCISLGIGHHFRNANIYRRDENVTKAFFWQMAWRIPGLDPGTSLLVNELPLHSTDNSLTAMINWIYAPHNNSAYLDYYLFYPEMRLGSSLPRLENSTTIVHDYLAATFYGSTDKVVAMYFAPPGCLRVLDPEIEPANSLLPQMMRYSAEYATLEPILTQTAEAAHPQEDIFGEELSHGWCYYFEKADLARQAGDWETVVELAETAFQLGDHPNDPIERTPFIEGYAHTGGWSRAVELTEFSFNVSSLTQPALCRVWDRIHRDTPESPGKNEARGAIEDLLNCSDL